MSKHLKAGKISLVAAAAAMCMASSLALAATQTFCTQGNGLPFGATGGDADWTVDADGIWRSGAITDGESSWAEIEVSGAPCRISFEWKASSEGGCDELHCYLDENEVVANAISGSMDDWASVVYVVTETGNHTLRFEYAKDDSELKGEDCGWVRNVAIVSVDEICNVTFDANEGAMTGVSSVAAAKGYPIGVLPTPERDGFAFAGWFTEAEGGTQVTVDMIVTGNLMLYAHWGDVVYTYSYIDHGDGTLTLSKYDENDHWIGDGVTPAPVGDFALPGEIDGKTVVAIGRNYFTGNKMTAISIPASVTNISAYALCHESGLTNIAIAADNPAYKSVDGILYTRDGKTLVACPHAKGGDVVVLPGTETVGRYAFYSNGSLTSVSLPDGLKGIEPYAFYLCWNASFTTVTIPDGVETIGAYAFSHCQHLETVEFAGSEDDVGIVPTAFVGTPYNTGKPFALVIDDGMLVGIRGVAPENLVIADYLNGQTLTVVGNSAFSASDYGTSSMTNVVVPDGVTSIYDYAFSGDLALSGVTLPASLQYIAFRAFSGCSSLREIRIPAGVNEIEFDVFYDCTNLTVYAPSTLEGKFSVPDDCTIEFYEIPEHTVIFNANGGTIAGEEVYEMTVLEGQTFDSLEDSLSGLRREGYDFAGWFGADGRRVSANFVVTGDVTFVARWLEASPWNWREEDGAAVISGAIDPVVVNGVMEIPATIAALNDNGEEVALPVVGIGSWAFEGMGGFTTLFIPASVEWIESGAFSWCKSLAIVAFARDMDAIDMQIGSVFNHTPWCDAQPFTWETNVEEGVVCLTGRYGSPVPKDVIVVPDGVSRVYTSALPDFEFDFDGGGYRRFLGWYTAAEGGERVGVEYFEGEYVRLVYFDVADGITLYAHWEPVEPEWRFNIEDGAATITGNSIDLVGDIVIPSSVTAEEEDEEGNMTDVSYPVTCIDYEAFGEMEGITSVTIPASVTRIGEWAFGACYGLTNVVFEGGMDSISMSVASAFEGTPWLEAYVASLPKPANDDFADATVISGEKGRAAGTNMGAGVEEGEPLAVYAESTSTVWWKWTAPKSGSYTFDTFGSDFDTVLGFYTGNAAEGFGIVAECDDSLESYSTVVIEAVAGTTYYISVGGYEDDMGSILLNWGESHDAIVYAGGNVVAANGDGSFTVTPPEGGVLTDEDADSVEVGVWFWCESSGEYGWIDVTAGYDIALAGGVITVRLAAPAIGVPDDETPKDPDDKSGFLVDPDEVAVDAAPTPDAALGESLGALPVRAVRGLWYRASWGDRLENMTEGEKVQATSYNSYLYLGVIRQIGTGGFYKVTVSEK